MGLYDRTLDPPMEGESRRIIILQKNQSPLWETIEYFREAFISRQMVSINAEVHFMKTDRENVSKKKAKKVWSQVTNLLLRPDLQANWQEFKDFQVFVVGGKEDEAVRIFAMNENMVKEVLALFSDEDNHYDIIPQELSRTFGDIEIDEEVTYEEPMLA